jgi:hypothetical protein
MIRQLTQDEYKNTMPTKMVDITDNAEAVVNIWEYVQQLKADKVVLDYVYDNQLVEKVYKNKENTFEHVLLPTDNPNAFIIIIVDLIELKIEGYFKLDLEKEYGIK